MPSSDQLALPTGWRPRQDARWGAIQAVRPLLALMAGYAGFSLLSSGYPEAAGGAWSLAALLALAGPSIRRRPGGRGPVHDPVRQAVRFGFSRYALVAELVGLACAAGFPGLLALAAAQERWWFWVVALAPLAVWAVGILGYRLFRGPRVGELVLSPGAVRLRVDATDVTVPWDDLLVFTSERTDRYGTVLRRTLDLGSYVSEDPLESYAVPLRRVDVDDVALYHLLEFYRRCPRARPELAGPDAVARWAARDYPAAPAT